jgi:cell fate regulator YaaT (PSP1 superfamily)
MSEPSTDRAPVRKGSSNGGGPGASKRAVVTVTFDLVGRRGDYAVDSSRLRPDVGDLVIVESRRGQALGRVVQAAHPATKRSGGRIRKVVRLAGPEDIAAQEAAEANAPELFRAALQELRDRKSGLKLVAAIPDAIARSVTYYTVGSERVDPEELAKAIGARVGMRVQLKQLGQRDETKALGGLGRCGQELCCSTFLPSYPATSIRQAKEQGMALGSDRTAGVCGKTLCCLAYEDELYTARRKYLPKTGKRAKTIDGVEGKVIGVDVMRGTFTLLDVERRTRQVLPAEAWEKNKDREVPPPEFPRTLAAPKTGGLRDRISNTDSLPAIPAAPPERDVFPSRPERSPSKRGRGQPDGTPEED